jgi:hypothetical protein
MGGWGSGWQGPKRTTVEECLVLSANTLARRQVLAPGVWAKGTWCWTREGEGTPFFSLVYEADMVDPADAWLRLSYRVRGSAMDYRIRLTTTRPTYGGVRWWFLCPLVRRDGGLPRRVGKLYRPPGARYFGSRVGHGLTYTSCQESGQFRGLFRLIAAELGTEAASVRAALTGRSRS